MTNQPNPNRRSAMPPTAKKVFSGQIFDVYQWEQRLYDGSTATFERLKRPDTVVVVPVLEDGRIIILDEEQPDRPPYRGVVGGRIEPDELPEEAAARELVEETGYTAQEFELMSQVQATDKVEWIIHTYIARGCQKTAEPKPDPGEKIEVELVDFNQFIDLFVTGKVNTPSLLEAILRAKLDPAKMAEFRQLLGQKSVE